MPVVDIRHMRVSMCHRRVRMRMSVRLRAFSPIVLVLMVLIVIVPMAVHHSLMGMLVLMLFAQHQPCRNHHQG